MDTGGRRNIRKSVLDETAEPRSLSQDDIFQGILSDSIFTSLRDVLGDDGLQVISYHFRLNEYARHPSKFHRHLALVFGKDGSIILERTIVKELFNRIGVPYEERGIFDFESSVSLGRDLTPSSSV